jgi:hypothetical protein
VGRESWTIVNRLGTETDVELELASKSAARVVLLSFDFLVEQPIAKSKDSTIEIIFIFNSPLDYVWILAENKLFGNRMFSPIYYIFLVIIITFF